MHFSCLTANVLRTECEAIYSVYLIHLSTAHLIDLLGSVFVNVHFILNQHGRAHGKFTARLQLAPGAFVTE